MSFYFLTLPVEQFCTRVLKHVLTRSVFFRMVRSFIQESSSFQSQYTVKDIFHKIPTNIYSRNWIKHSFRAWRGYLSRQAWSIIYRRFHTGAKTFMKWTPDGLCLVEYGWLDCNRPHVVTPAHADGGTRIVRKVFKENTWLGWDRLLLETMYVNARVLLANIGIT